LRPSSIAEAYAAQEACYRLAETTYGVVGGAKIATTTKVMQQLMGIDHPCGGAIFARTIHASPATLDSADFGNLRIESEIALKLGADLPALARRGRARRWRRRSRGGDGRLRADRGPQCGLLEGRSLIVENCWNGGIVTGAPKALPAGSLAGIPGRLAIDGKIVGEGKSEDPCATLPSPPIMSPNAAAGSKPA